MFESQGSVPVYSQIYVDTVITFLITFAPTALSDNFFSCAGVMIVGTREALLTNLCLSFPVTHI